MVKTVNKKKITKRRQRMHKTFENKILSSVVLLFIKWLNDDGFETGERMNVTFSREGMIIHKPGENDQKSVAIKAYSV